MKEKRRLEYLKTKTKTDMIQMNYYEYDRYRQIQPTARAKHI